MEGTSSCSSQTASRIIKTENDPNENVGKMSKSDPNSGVFIHNSDE